MSAAPKLWPVTLLAAALIAVSSAAQPPEAPAPVKNAPAPVVATNPRGEPLLFEPGSTEFRPGEDNWWSVSVSPDGKTIATGNGRGNTLGEVKIWDRESGKILRTLTEPKGVRTVAFSPDGNTLATGNYDAGVRFYDARTFKLLAVGNKASGGHGTGVNGLCYFKDGNYLATAGLDNTSRIWNVAAIRAKAKSAKSPVSVPPVAVFEGHTQGVLSVSVSTDGLTLLSGSFDRTARCYDVPDPLPKMGEKPAVVKKERVLLQGHNNAVEAVAVSPDGQLLVTGSWDAQLLVRDRDGKKVEFQSRFQRGVMCAAFSEDGKYLAAGAGNAGSSQPGELRVWEVAAKRQVAYRADYPGAVLGVGFTPDGKTVASVGQDRALHLWPHAEKDRKTHTPPGLNFGPQPYLAAAVSPDGRLLAVSGEGKSVFVLDRREGKLLTELAGHEDVVAGLAFSPDGGTLATASYDRMVKLWDTATWKQRGELQGHTGWVLGLAFSPDGRTIATGSYDKSVRLWDAEKCEPKATWKEHTAGVRSVAFSPDGKKLVSGGSDRVVRIWDAADGTVLHSLKGHKGAVRSVVFSPDGKTVASGSEDKSVKVWDATAGKELTTFSGLPDMVTAIRFSPKGQSIIAATFQGPVIVLDPITGRTRQTLRAHNDAVTAVVYAEDGQTLLTVSMDRGIRLWKPVPPADQTSLVTFRGPTQPVNAVAVSPDGRKAITGSPDGSLTYWNASAGVSDGTITNAHPGGVEQVARSPTDETIASVGKDSKVQVWSAGRDRRWSAPGTFAAFTPDGRHLAVVRGKDVVFYRTADGTEGQRFTGGHGGDVLRVAFSPDGKLMASAGEDTKVRLWDTATGKKRQETPAFGNYSTITQLAFSPDGTRLAVAAYGPDRPPPDDMTGNFRVTRQVNVFAVPAADAASFPANPVVFNPQPQDQEITGLAWDAGGQLLITPANDGTVRVTEIGPTSAREVKRFRAHEAAVIASAVAPESRVFLTAGEDLAVKRWALPGTDVPPGQARLIPPSGGKVWAAAPSPDGKYLVTAGSPADKTFQVYTGLPGAIPVEPDKYGAVFALAFSPDNKLLVTGHEKGVMVVREAATGKPLRTLPGLAKRVSSVAFAEGGAALVAVGGNWMNGDEPGEAVVWDFPAGTVRHKLDAPVLQRMVAVHPDGKTAVGAGNDGKARVWDLTTGKLVTTFAKGGGLFTVAFDADGRRLAAGSADHMIRIWDTSSGALLREIATNPNLRPSQALFTPDGKEIVVSLWLYRGQPPRAPELAVFSLDTPDAKPRLLPAHPAAILNIAFLPDGKTLVASGGETNGGSLRVYDYATGKMIAQYVGHRNWAQSLAVSPDGRRIASTGWANPSTGDLRLWETAAFRPVATVRGVENNFVSCAAVSPDSKTLALGGWGKTVSLWDMTDPKKPVLRKELKGHTAELRSVAFSSDGERLVSSDESGVVKVWDVGGLKLVVSFQASAFPVYRAKFTPDGKAVVTCAGNYKDRTRGELRVWDPATGKETGRFPDQSREVWDVTFLDGGKTMVTAQATGGQPGDAPVKVWDFAGRSLIRSVNVLAGIRCLEVSPDGKYLAVANHSGQYRVVETATWQVIQTPPDHARVIFRLAFTPDSKAVIAASEDESVSIVRVPVLGSPAAADEKPARNPRQVAEAYLSAALAGKTDDAVKLAVEGQSPSRAKNVEELRQMIDAEKLPVAKGFVSEGKGRAVVVTEVVKIKERKPDQKDEGCLVLTLTRTTAGWRVKDIDIETEDAAKRKYDDAMKKYDDAKELLAGKG